VHALIDLPSYPSANIGRVIVDPDDVPPEGGRKHELPPAEGIDPVVARRIIRHLTTASSDKGIEKAYNQGTAAIFVYICNVLGMDHSTLSNRGRNSKRLLFEAIRIEVQRCSVFHLVGHFL